MSAPSTLFEQLGPVQAGLSGLAAAIAGAGAGASLILAGFLVPLLFKHLDHGRADRVSRLFLAGSGPLIAITFWIAGALALLGFSLAGGISMLAVGALYALAGITVFPKGTQRAPTARRNFTMQRQVALSMTFLLTPIGFAAAILAALRL